MKIAIITVFYNSNYGAVLQAYALTQVISKISGKECYLVDYRRNKIINMFRNSLFDVDAKRNKRLTKNSIKRRVKQIINPRGTTKRFNNFEQFRKKYMNISEKVYFEGENIHLENTDIVFLGSDQIWNPDITQGFNEVYFGKLGHQNLFTISYAASLGKTVFTKEEKSELRQLIKNVEIISVREEEGAKTLRELTDKKITCVPDPTILLDKEQWLTIANKNHTNENKYILVYMLAYNQKLIDTAYKIKKKYNYEIILFDSGQLPRIKGMIQKKSCGPSEFLNYIANSEFIITNSFHGTVFSVIFNKDFYTFPGEKKGSRITNFCNKTGLENRVIYTNSRVNDKDIDKHIDYEKVETKLEKLKITGIDFIKEALEVAKNEQI